MEAAQPHHQSPHNPYLRLEDAMPPHPHLGIGSRPLTPSTSRLQGIPTTPSISRGSHAKPSASPLSSYLVKPVIPQCKSSQRATGARVLTSEESLRLLDKKALNKQKEQQEKEQQKKDRELKQQEKAEDLQLKAEAIQEKKSEREEQKKQGEEQKKQGEEQKKQCEV